MEKIARCVQTIKGVPIYLDVEDIDESDDVANDQGRQYNKDIGPESFAGGGVAGTRRGDGPVKRWDCFDRWRPQIREQGPTRSRFESGPPAKTKKEEIMGAKELFEELKAKADELHKYLEANPEEANMVPSWMFSCFSTEKGFLLQGCSNVQHGAEVVVQFLHKLSENSIAAFMRVALEVANLMNAKRKEIEGTGEGESPQWIQ